MTHHLAARLPCRPMWDLPEIRTAAGIVSGADLPVKFNLDYTGGEGKFQARARPL